MDIVQSIRFFKKKLIQYKTLEKIAALLLLFPLKKKLFKRSLSLSHQRTI